MSRFAWWFDRSHLTNRRARRRQPNRDSRVRRLRLESLEDRRLLALTTDTFSAGVLTVNFNGADQVAISSSGGNVLVNGANPTSGAAAVGSVTAINITGTGNFDNTIDLSGVSAANGFGHLSSVTVASGGAVSGDTILMGPLNASGAASISSGGPSQITLAAGLTAGSLMIAPGVLSDIYLDGSVTTSGAQDYAAPTWIESDTVLSAGDGNITFGSMLDGAHNLTVDSAGITTFAGVVGGAVALSSLTTDAAGSTVVDTSITTSGSAGLTFNDPITLGGNATLAAGEYTVSVNNTIDGAHALVIDSSYMALTGAIGAQTPLVSVYLEADFTSTFSGGSITTTGYQTYDTDLTLGADTTFNAGTAMILVESALDGAYHATFNTSGSVDFNSVLGGNTALAGVTTNAAGTTIINNNVTTTGDQIYNSPVTLVNYPTLAAGSGNITFKSTVDGGSLTTSTTGTTTFDGAVSQNTLYGSFTTDAGGTTVLAGGSINATYQLTFGNAVELGSDMSIEAQDFAIAFNGTVDGAHNLTVSGNGVGGVTFAAAVGGTDPLTSLTTSNREISLQSVTTTGSQTYDDQAVSLAGTYASSGNFSVENGVTLLGQTNIQGNNVALNTVDGAFGLNIVSTASTTLAGLVGGTTPLASLSITTASAINIGANVHTSGNQSYSHLANVASGALLSAGGVFSFTSTAPILTPIVPVLTSVIVTQTSSTTELVSSIVGNSILTQSGLDGIAITAQSTPGGSWQYSLDGLHWANFGTVSNSNSLLLAPTDSIRFEPDGTHTGTATFTYRGWDASAGTAGTLANTTFSGNDTAFSATSDSASIAIQIAPAIVTDSFSGGELNVTVIGSQNVMITGVDGHVLVNSANPTSGVLSTSAVLYINVIVTGGYSNLIDLTGVSAVTGFSALAGVVVNAGGPGSSDQVELGTLNASGAVSVIGAGSDAVTTPANLVAGSVSITGTTINLNSVTTTGNQTYNGAVTLAGAATISAGSGNVTFNGTIDGDRTLTVDSSGVTTFGAAVGGKTALASLTTDAAGSTVLDASVTTAGSGSVTINDPLTLGANLTLSGGTFNDVSINNTIDGAYALTFSDWDLTLAGAVGSKTALASLSMNTEMATFSGGSITTTGQQTYQSALQLGANAIFNAGSSTILAEASIYGPYSATFNTTGLTQFAGYLGSGTPLASLATGAGGTTVINDGVQTTGNQTYNNPVVVGNNADLTAGSGNITFNGIVSGGGLTTNTTGITRFNAPIGQVATLNSLTTDSGGSTVLAGGYIATIGGMTFNNAVVLASDMDVVSDTFSVLFNSTVDGAYNLTAGQNGSSSSAFYGAVGGTTPLASLTVAGSSSLIGSATTTGPQLYESISTALNGVYTTTTGSFDVAGSAYLDSNTTINAAEAISLGTVAGNGYGLNIVSGATMSFGGTISYTQALANLTVSAPEGVYIDRSVATTGNQTYSLPVVVAQGASLTSTTGTISQVASVPTAPVLTPIAPLLAPVSVALANSTASQVSAIVGNSITDNNGLYGLAVVGQASPGGSWQYSLDGGTNWTNFGTVSDSQSLLLAPTDMIRFAPDGTDTGLATFTYRAWNKTTGVAGSQVDTTVRGGETAFSTAIDTASIGVQVAPVVTTDTFSSGVLTVVVDGAENVTISSSGGHLLVNGANPSTGVALTNAVTAIDITATAGQYDNTINLAGVSAAQGFTSLASISVNTGGSYYGDYVQLGTLNASGLVSITGTGSDTLTTPTTLVAGSISITATAMNLHSVTTTGSQTYNTPVTLTSTATLSAGSGNVTFYNTVDGNFGLTVNSSGVTTFAGAVGSHTAFSSLTTDAAGSTVLGAPVNVLGSLDINDPLTLSGNVTLDGGTYAYASVTAANITSTIDGPYALVIDSRNMSLGGAIGSTTPLTSLVVGAPSSALYGYSDTFSGGAITTAGPQTINVELRLNANTTLNAGSGTILVQGGLLGDSVTFYTSGLTDLAPGFSSGLQVNSLTTGVAGTTTINGAVYTTGNQTYNNPVTIAQSASTYANSGSLTFNSTVDGGSLTAESTGTTTFNGAVGAIAPLTSLVTWPLGTTVLAGGTIMATSTITFANPVMLGADLSVASKGSVVFDGTVDGAYKLTISQSAVSGGNFVGGEYFAQPVGGNIALASLTTVGGGLSLRGVTTTGLQTYNNRSLDLGGLYAAGTGPFSITSPVVLAGNTVINATGAVSLDIVDGAYGLNIVSGGNTTLSGPIGQAAPLASVTVISADGVDIYGNVITTGNQVYKVPVTLGSGVILTSTAGTVSQVASVDTAPLLAPIEPTLPAANLSEVSSTPVSVGTMVANSVTDDNGLYGVAVFGQSTPGGSWQYSLDGGVTWTNFGALSNTQSLLLAPTNLVRFAPDSVHTGTATFSYRAWNLTTGNAGTLINTTTNGASTGFSTGTDTASIPVQIAPVIATDTFSNGVLTVDVDGSQNVGINLSDGLVLINSSNPTTGAVSASAVTAIDITASPGNYDNIINLSLVSAANGFTALRSVAVNTGGSLVGDEVELGELDASGLVSISGTGIDAVYSSQTLEAGSLSITSTSFNTESVTTTGDQTYNTAVTLASDDVFSAGSGNVTFNGTVEGEGLTTNTTGTTTFNGAVGKTVGLVDLATNGGTTVLAGGSIAVGTGVTFNSAVVLGSDMSITATEYPTPTIDFASTVDGAFDLIADSDGLIDFGGVVGGITPLASIISKGFTTPAAGTTEINARVNTSGAQTYSHPLEIGPTGSISEGVNLAAGTYNLNFLAVQGSNNQGPQSLQLSVDGTPIGVSITPAGSTYAAYGSETFSVAAGMHVLTLAGLNPQGGANTALVSGVSIQQTTANQLADPDFSGANVGAGNWQYAPSDSPWSFTGTAGVSGNGGAIAGGNPNAPQGSQVAFLQGSGSISQAIGLPAGTYTIEFEAAQRGNYNFGGQSLQVLIDGMPLAGSITPSGSVYSPYATAVFTVTAGSHTITIVGLNPHGGDNTALVSAITIQPAAANQLADPDFSAATVGAGNWQYAPSGSAWFFTGSAGESGNGGAIAGGNPNAPQGSQVAFLQGSGSISQAVNLSAGTYSVELEAAQRGNYNFGGQSVQVLVDGTPIGVSFTPAGSNYAAYCTQTFSVTAGMHVITIAGLNPLGGDNTALVTAVSIQQATANQLADADFSAANVGAANWQYAPSGSPWLFTGTAGLSGNGGAIAGGNPNAPQGSQVAFLQRTGSISQAISLSAGTYTIEFEAAQRGNYNFGGQSLQVLIDGTPLAGTITPTGSVYSPYATAVFNVTAGSHMITIAGLDPMGGDNTALVSAVSIQPATANELGDSDFGAAAVGAGNWQYAPGGSPWYFSGTAGVSGNGGAIAGGNPNAPQGSQVAFLQGSGSISQAVNLPAGTYTVEFQVAQRGNYNFGGQSLQVLIDGTPLAGSITPTGSAYSSYATAVFTLAAGSHSITIAGLNPKGGDNTALVSAVTIQPATANQLADADFGAAGVGAGNWQYAPSGSPWTFTSSAGISGNGGAIAGGNPNAPQGTQVAFLQGNGTISQAVNLSAGTYTIEFEAAQRGNYNFGGQTLQVSIDGTPLAGSITPTGSAYSPFATAVFTVTAGSHTVTFAGLNPKGGDNTALVSAVTIQPTTANQLADPNFSAAAVGAGNWQYAPSGSAWFFTGSAGESGNGGAIAGGNPNAPQGSQVAFLQGNGSISQAVNLSAGTYKIEFEAAQRGNYNFGGQSLQVSIDGTPLAGSFTPTGSAYSPFATAVFTVTAGSHNITIGGLNPLGGDNTALLDDVRIISS